MNKILSGRAILAMMVFAAFNLCVLSSCNEETTETKTETTTTATETTTPVTTTTTTVESPAPPKDSLAVSATKTVDTGKMDKATTKPTEEGKKK